MKQILIIEDHLQSLKLERDLLLNAGYGVLEAGNAEDGIGIAIEKQPDMILIDIQLPEMDGLHAIEILKKDSRTKKIPCIIVTASIAEREIKEYCISNCDGYITKPINTRTFVKEVEQYISLI